MLADISTLDAIKECVRVISGGYLSVFKANARLYRKYKNTDSIKNPVCKEPEDKARIYRAMFMLCNGLFIHEEPTADVIKIIESVHTHVLLRSCRLPTVGPLIAKGYTYKELTVGQTNDILYVLKVGTQAESEEYDDTYDDALFPWLKAAAMMERRIIPIPWRVYRSMQSFISAECKTGRYSVQTGYGILTYDNVTAVIAELAKPGVQMSKLSNNVKDTMIMLFHCCYEWENWGIMVVEDDDYKP